MLKEPVSGRQAIHLHKIDPHPGSVEIGWSKAGVDPIDHAAEGVAAPQNVGRVEIAVNETGISGRGRFLRGFNCA